jgi:hypothetical protein
MAVKGVRQRNYSLLVYVDVLGVLRRLPNCCGDSMLLEVLLVNFICIPKGLTSVKAVDLHYETLKSGLTLFTRATYLFAVLLNHFCVLTWRHGDQVIFLLLDYNAKATKIFRVNTHNIGFILQVFI